MLIDNIEYEVLYSNIKNVYIQIKDERVLVKAPKKISKRELEKIVLSKKEWIEKSLQKTKRKKEKKSLYKEEEFIQLVNDNVNDLVKITGIIPNNIRIRNIKYAWGSCSINKNITINYKLIKYSEQAIRYVILHELCHIKYMNHSKDFWNLIERYMPNFRDVKKEFKE